MQGRFLVPKNILFYVFFFLVMLGGWTGTLWLYYRLSDISHLAGAETLPFLDLNQTGSFGQWFISLMWLLIAVHSFMMIFFVISRSRRELYEAWIREAKGADGIFIPKYNGLIKVLFWLAVFGVSFVMSAETICRFSPFIYRRLHEVFLSLAQGEDSDASVFYLVLMIAALAFVFVTAGCLRQYINSVRKSRWILYPFFFATSLALGLTILFQCLIPDPTGMTDEERIKAAMIRLPELSGTEGENGSVAEDDSSEDPPEENGRSASPRKKEKKRGSGFLGRKLKDQEPDSSNSEEERKEAKEKENFLLVSYEKSVDPADRGEETSFDDNDAFDEEDGAIDEEDGAIDEENKAESAEKNGHASARSASSCRNASDSTETASAMTAKNVDGPRSVEIADIMSWEDILGWDETIEERLKLEKSLEEYWNLTEPSENYVLSKLPPLDLIQIRTLLRQGFYGLFLVFLSAGLGFLARAERLVFDKKLSIQANMFRHPFYRERRSFWGPRNPSDHYLG